LRAIVAAVLLVLLLFAPRAFAAPAAEIDASTKHLWLAPHLDVYEDTTAKLDLAGVTGPGIAARFTPYEGRVGPNLAYTSSALWVRFAIENTSDVPMERWLVVDVPFVEHMEVFRDGEPPATQGVLHPRSERELPRRSYSFRIALAPHQTRTVHVRCWGYAEIMLPLQLWELGALGEADQQRATFSALCLGVMLAMAIYNAFLFLYVRDRSHLYYAGYVIGIGLWCMCIDGSLLDVLPDRVQVLPHWVNLVTAIPALMLAGLFVRGVLSLPSSHPRLDRALLASLALMWPGPLAYLLGIIDYRLQNIVARPAFIVAILVQIAASVVRWRDGLARAAYVLFGWLALFGMVLYVQLALFGRIPVVPPPLSFGYSVEAILLSLALAGATRERAKQVEDRGREVSSLNEELRHQVAERSRELTEALARAEGTVSPASLGVGDVFDGRYRVVRELGRGGMGAVFDVERTRDGGHFALKVVTASLSAKNAARVAREAEIGARLRHENLVSIVDVGIAAGGTPFLVMELVRGGSMEEQRRRFGDVAWAVALLRQIATGLRELHAGGVVHRDLKPGNVLLVDGQRGGTPTAKISDFGISSREATPQNLTEEGALLGTPVYMPPEAWLEPARHASADLFSFGVLAYEALTGRSPFAVPAILLARAGQPVPQPTPLEGVSEAVARLVIACLQAEPSKRPTAREVADGLS